MEYDNICPWSTVTFIGVWLPVNEDPPSLVFDVRVICIDIVQESVEAFENEWWDSSLQYLPGMTCWALVPMAWISRNDTHAESSCFNAHPRAASALC